MINAGKVLRAAGFIFCLAVMPALKAQAAQKDAGVLCQTLLAAPFENFENALLETYRQVVFEIEAELISISDLERMIQSKDYFFIENKGSSKRDHISSALRAMKQMIESRGLSTDTLYERLDEALRKELAGRTGSHDKQLTERKQRNQIGRLSWRFKAMELQFLEDLRASLSPDQKTLVEASRNKVRVLDFETGKEISFLELSLKSDLSVPGNKPIAVSPDGSIRIHISQEELSLASSGRHYRLWLSDQESNPIRTLGPFFSRTDFYGRVVEKDHIFFAADSSFFVILSPFNGGTVWGIAASRDAKLTDEDGRGLNIIDNQIVAAISPDSRYIAVGRRLFDSRSGKFLHFLDGSGTFPGSAVGALAISPDSRWIAGSGAFNKSEIGVFDIQDGSQKIRLQLGDSYAAGLMFSHDGKLLIYRTTDGFWNVRDISESLGMGGAL